LVFIIRIYHDARSTECQSLCIYLRWYLNTAEWQPSS